jgi:hemerythrin-like domain-containing protein
MSSATQVLRDEHRLILQALASLEAAARRLGGGTLSEELWAAMIGWLRAFADRNHHAKEESALFPAMVQAGVPARGGPIDVMLNEHTEGRALLRTMESRAPAERVAAAHRYVGLLRDHIDKENGVLFPLADAVLDEREQAELCRAFARLEVESGEAACLIAAEEATARFTAALEA